MSGATRIEATVRHRSGAEVCRLWLKAVPSSGEILLLGGWQSRVLAGKEGTQRFRVVEVVHACIAELTQGSRRGTEPDHDVVLVVDPILAVG